jgi:hypothetical protein
MELIVDFECPECRKVASSKVSELSPRTERRCAACDARVVLTERGMHELRGRLRELYPTGAL